MRWHVEVTQLALEDAREAARYTQEHLAAPHAAHDFIVSFEKQVQALATMPEGRPLVSDYELAQLGYRWCAVGNFMLFYRANRENATVTIDRLLYGARDWRSWL